MQIHSTALIAPGASLGERVEIGPYAVIAADTVIGPGTRIGPHAVIHPHTTLGSNCAVHAHAVIGDNPQDFAFDPATLSHVIIGDNVTLREHVTIHRGTKSGTSTEVGDGCFL